MKLKQVVIDHNLAKSFGEVRKLCGLGAVKLNNQVVTDAEKEINKGDVISWGKSKQITIS